MLIEDHDFKQLEIISQVMDDKETSLNLFVCETYQIGFLFICDYFKSATIRLYDCSDSNKSKKLFSNGKSS